MSYPGLSSAVAAARNPVEINRLLFLQRVMSNHASHLVVYRLSLAVTMSFHSRVSFNDVGEKVSAPERTPIRSGTGHRDLG